MTITWNNTAAEACASHLDQLTKPRGSLGLLEQVAIQLAGISGRSKPCITRPRVVLFAGDHGVTAQGVSAFPAEVTLQMCANFCQGGAAAAVLAQQHGAKLSVVDVGVAGDLAPELGVEQLKVQPGTNDFTQGPAMSEAHCNQAMNVGARIVEQAMADGCDILLPGEMGIGNTTSAAALLAALLGLPARDVCGRGTGIDDAGLQRKIQAVEQGIARHVSVDTSPMQILQRLGGYEIAALVGCYRAAGTRGLPVVVDGFICTAAALVACRLEPGLERILFFAHSGAEHAHPDALQAMNARPLLSLDLRLGEGSGALLALPLLQSACAIVNNMATFEQAQVSEEG